MVHGESLPNRTCADCGESFYDEKAQPTYCDDCFTEAEKLNGNWKNATQEEECRICGEVFEYYPSNKKGVFCPQCVAESDEFLGTPAYAGKVTEKVTTSCEQCGTPVTVRKSKRAYGAGRFCSRQCLADWQSENWQGEDHPGWKGGWNERRIRNWSKAKRNTLQRDDHQCQRCGRTAKEMGREPDVHHIVPIREFDEPNDAHTLDNLVALCRGFHMAIEYGNASLPE